MRYGRAAFASVVLFITGCSKTQITTLLAEKWDTGQHRTCLYGHQHLYCFQPDQMEAGQVNLAELAARKLTPYSIELKREEALKESGADGGVYETRFQSHTPMDVSSWDCYKTGSGSPAMVCDLKQQPTKAESESFVKAESEQKEQYHLEETAANYFTVLEPEELIAACGKGHQVGTYASSVDRSMWMQYPFGDFKFQYLGMYLKDVKPATTCNEPSNSCEARFYLENVVGPGFWDSSLQLKYHDKALDVVQKIPCLLERASEKQTRIRSAICSTVPQMPTSSATH